MFTIKKGIHVFPRIKKVFISNNKCFTIKKITLNKNCRRIGIFDRRRGPSSLGLPEGVKECVVKVGIVHDSLPSFRLHGGGGALRAAITHYKADRRFTGYNELWEV